VNKAPSIDHLIAANADVSHLGKSSRGPLAYAAYRGNLAYVRSLLVAGAKIDSRDVEAMTPLMIALAMRHAEVALLLADAGADLRARNRRGKSVIWFAAAANHVPILRRAKAQGERLGWVNASLLRLSGWMTNRFHR
jgi:ankyrin repeat protein